MKILKIALLTACAGLMLAGLAIFIVAKTLLTPPVIKDALALEIRRQLGREISCGAVDVDLLRGIRIQDLRILKSLDDEEQDIFTCRELQLQHSLATLLFKKLLIKQIAADGAAVHIQVSPGQPLRLRGRGRPDPAAASRLGIFALPTSIQLKNASIVLADLPRKTRLEFTGVQAGASGISLLTPLNFDVRAELPNCPAARLTCSGTYSLRTGALTATAALEQLALQAFDQLLVAYGLPVRTGMIAARLRVASAGQGSLKINGTCELTDAEVAMKSMPASNAYAGLEGLDLSLDIQAAYDAARGGLDIEKISGQLLSTPYQGSGSLRRTAGMTAVEGTLRAPGFSLDNLFKKLVIRGLPLPPGLRLGGPVDLQLHLAGSLPGRLAPALIVSLNNNPIVCPQLGWLRPELRGELRIDPKTISLNNVSLGTDNTAITLAGDITAYDTWPPRSNLKVASSRIDFPKIFAAGAVAAGDEVGPLDLGSLRLDGPIKLGNAAFFGMKLADVRGSYQFKDSKLHIQDLRGSLEQGSFTASGTLDLAVKGLDYYTSLRFNAVPLKTVLAMVPGYNTQFIDGVLSGTCALKGSGTQPANAITNLRGDLIVNIANATIKGLALIPQISSFIRSDKLGEIAFSAANLRFALADGVVDLTGSMLSPYLELYPAGQIGLDSTLALEVRLKVAPEALAINSKLAQYLPQEGGWPTLPMVVTGTLQRPRVALSEEALNFIVKKTLPQLLMDLLSQAKAAQADVRNKDLPPPKPAEQKSAEPEEVYDDPDEDADPEPENDDNLTYPEDDEE